MSEIAGAPATLDTDGPLWRFAVSFYGEEGVAPACLTLQARLGLDVNLLLMALFALIERGLALDADALADADAAVSPWHHEVVRALRQVRTRLKEGPPPAPSPPTDRLRHDVKAAELRAEQIELALLGDWLDRRPPAASPAGPAGRMLADVIRHAGGDLADQDGSEIAIALATLADAADRRLRVARPNTRL